jgi:transcriptional regulator with GAF, ATPase, and Fis domain
VIDLPPAAPSAASTVPTPISAASESPHTLADLEEQQIRKVLESTGWRVRGPGGAAEILGIKPNTLDSRMTRLGIRRPQA